jgi:hypothetical protein
VASSTKLVRRLDFVLRVLLISALALALEHFLKRYSFQLSKYLPHGLYSIAQVIVFCLPVMYLSKTTYGRLLDAGLPRSYAYPAFAIWFISIELPTVWSRGWPVSVFLMLLLLIAGGLVPSKVPSRKHALEKKNAEGEETVSEHSSNVPPRLLVGPIGFLRTLLTFACILFPLILLEKSSGRGIGAPIAHLGYGIVYLVWLLKVLGRFADSGRPSTWYWFPYCIVASIVSVLPLWYRLFNEYEALGLFLLIQVPLALLPSKRMPEEQSPPQKVLIGYKRDVELKARSVQPLLVGTRVFLLRLMVITSLCALLIYIESESSDEIVLWFERIGYFVLGVAWMVNANGRLQDAGWAHTWYPSQYFLVVSVASLMPLAVHWVNGYGALAIFVLIQIPILFLPSKPAREPASSNAEAPSES